MPSAKKNLAKLPKNMQKSKREKLKRDGLNELLLKLAKTLEPTLQNNGKATIISSVIKELQDLGAKVESLRKEKASLISDERYVSAEVAELQNDLKEYNPVCKNDAAPTPSVPQPFPVNIPIQQAAGIAPLCIIPVAHTIEFPQEKMQEPSHTHQVSRPQARYPTGPDSWPNCVFSQHQSCQGEGRGSPTKVLNLF